MLDVKLNTGILVMDNIRSLDCKELKELVHCAAAHNEILFMFHPSKMTDISSNYIIDIITKEELLKVFEILVAKAFHVFNKTRANSKDKDDDNNNNNNNTSKKILMIENRTKRVSKSPSNNKVKKMKTTEVVEEEADVEYDVGEEVQNTGGQWGGADGELSQEN